MPDTIRVVMAGYAVAKSPDLLETQALGSCVGIVIYDEEAGIAGMAHAMLPDFDEAREVSKGTPSKFVNSAIELLVKELVKLGGKKARFRAKLAGGANMFPDIVSTKSMAIGERNIISAHDTLKSRGITITGEETGGHIGRTIVFDTKKNTLLIKAVVGNNKVI